MVSMMLLFTPDEHIAIKHWAMQHGYKSKSEACAEMLKRWLKAKGYYHETTEELLFDEGYENV